MARINLTLLYLAQLLKASLLLNIGIGGVTALFYLLLSEKGIIWEK